MDKIDIYDSDNKLKVAVVKLRTEKEISKKNRELIIDFLDKASIGQTLSSKRKQVGTRAQLKGLYLLKSVAKFIKKDFDKITKSDMEKIIRSLNEDKFRSYKDKKYSEQTKANIKKQFILFLRWLNKGNEKYHDLTDWIDTRYKKKEKEYLREDEVELVVKKANTLKQRFLFTLLFDTGCRIEEFLNIRFGDLVKVQGEMSYYKVTIRNEFSKTSGRTFGLFWKHSTPLIDEWLQENPNKKLDEPLFNSTYNGVRVLLAKIGKRVLGKHLTPHLMRHSSATYYASKLNRQQLCIRYGWAFSSNMPDVYIARAGVDDERIVDDVKKERLGELQMVVDSLKQENRINSDKIKEFDKVKELLNQYLQETGSKKRITN